MAFSLSSSKEDMRLLPNLDSDGEPIDELYSLGLNYENLPPEFRKTYDECTEDEKAYHDLKTKWLKELRENRTKKVVHTPKLCESLKELINEEIQEVPTGNYNEILHEINTVCDSIVESEKKLKQLNDKLNAMMALCGVPEVEQKRLNNHLKSLRNKLDRNLPNLTVRIVRKRAERTATKKMLPICTTLKVGKQTAKKREINERKTDLAQARIRNWNEG